jgi:membrane protein
MTDARGIGQSMARNSWVLIQRVAKAWSDDNVSSMGAALAYYTMFSLAPLLLIVISVAGLYFGESAARGEIENQLRFMMGEVGAKAVLGLLSSVQNPVQSVAASVLGLLLLLIGATTVFGELHEALDRIWCVPARQHSRGILTLLRTRLLSFGMILSIGFLLMVSLVMSTVLAIFGQWWGSLFGGWLVAATIVDALAGYLLVTLMFALIYKIMPSARAQWRDVWIGSVFTAVLFILGKWLIGYYIGHSGVVTGFGAAGSLVVILIWVYYSAQIFLIGAEFTWIYANLHGSRKPSSASDSS